MAVYKRGYQRYQGELTPHWRRLLVLPRTSWERLFRQRLVVVLLAVSMLWPLLCAGYIYLASHMDLLQGAGGPLSRIVEI